MQLITKDNYNNVQYHDNITVLPTVGSNIVINGTMHRVMQVIIDYQMNKVMVRIIPEWEMNAIF